MVAKYCEANPKFADEFITEFREQALHRRRLERAASRRETLGLLLAFLVAVSFLVVSAYLIAGGHGLAGTSIATVDIIALATAFIFGRAPRPGGRD